MKDETDGLANEEFVGLKPKMYSYLVDDNSDHKKAKSVNKNVVATISHNEYKDVLLNKKCFRHSINRIQSKDHKINKNVEIDENSLSYFDDKIYIQKSSWLLELIIKKTVILIIIKKTVMLITVKKSLFVKQIVLISFLVRTAFLSSKLF